jgi:hypothetical protein
MSERSDILVFDQNDRPILAIEVKTKVDASVDWANRLRQNIFAHDRMPDTEFFLIATPSRFFIWKNPGMDSLWNKPASVIDAGPLLAPYFDQVGVAPEEISGSSFELIINSWLAEMIYSGITPDQVNGSYQWMTELGLLDALKNGHLGQEVFA